jgi:hypothetical protein
MPEYLEYVLHYIQLSMVCLAGWNLGMESMDSLQELQTVEVLDIWNEEFGGIDIDWTGFDAFLVGKNDGDANNNGKEVAEKENVEIKNKLKAKRGRPRLKPLKPEVLSLRRDVSNLYYIQNLYTKLGSCPSTPSY